MKTKSLPFRCMWYHHILHNSEDEVSKNLLRKKCSQIMVRQRCQKDCKLEWFIYVPPHLMVTLQEVIDHSEKSLKVFTWYQSDLSIWNSETDTSRFRIRIPRHWALPLQRALSNTDVWLNYLRLLRCMSSLMDDTSPRDVCHVASEGFTLAQMHERFSSQFTRFRDIRLWQTNTHCQLWWLKMMVNNRRFHAITIRMWHFD